MSDFKEDIRELNIKYRRDNNLDLIRAVVGDTNGNYLWPQYPGQVVVRVQTSNGLSTPRPVWPPAGKTLTLKAGTNVILEYDKRGQLRIAEPDTQSTLAGGYNPIAAIVQPVPTQRTNQIEMETLAVMPTVPPSLSVILKSWNPIINNTAYQFAGALVNLTSYVPSSGNMRYAVIFVKSDYATTEVFASTARSISDLPLDVNDIQECLNSKTTGSTPVYAVMLIGDQTEITLNGLQVDGVPLQQLVNTSEGSGSAIPAAAQGDLLYGSATNVWSKLAKSTTATRYLSNTGTSNNPAWAQVNLTNGVTGTLPVANGGTGAASLTANNVILGNGTSAVQFVAPGSSGNVLKSNGTTWQSAAPAALTKTDDTNVTLTLGGTPTTALLAATSLTLGWTGQLAVTRGGTGLATVAQGDLLYGSASNTLSALAKNTSATRYLSNTGTSNNPAWAQIDLTNGVTGALPVANGGTGQTTANAALNALLPSQTGNNSKYLTTDGTDTSWATVSAVTPGGADGNVQYNNSGTFGGENNFNWDATNDTLTITGGADAARLVLKQHSAQTLANPAISILDSAGDPLLSITSNNVNGVDVANILVGVDALASNTPSGVILGQNNIVVGTSGLYYGTTAFSNIVIGNGSTGASGGFTGFSNIVVGHSSLVAATSAHDNIGFGNSVFGALTTGAANFAAGLEAALSLTTASNTVYLGPYAGRQNTGADGIVGIGYASAYAVAAGSNVVSVGLEALRLATSSSSTVAIGARSLYSGTGTINNTVAVGFEAGFTNNTSSNVYVGYRAGLLHTGTASVFIGTNAGGAATAEDNVLYIANSNTATPLIYGDFNGAALTTYGTLTAQYLGGSTSAVTNVLSVINAPTANTSAGFGTGISIQGYSATRTNGLRDMAQIVTEWATVTDASRTSKLTFRTYNISTAVNVMVLDHQGYVGIGRTPGTFMLDIQNTANNNAVRITGQQGSVIQLIDQANSRTLQLTVSAPGSIGMSTNHGLAIITNNLTRLTIGASGLITVADGINFAFNATTGTKFGTSVSDKFAFWNATPIVQPSGAAQAALTNSTGGTGDGTLSAVSGTGDDTNINNNFTELYTLLNALRTAALDTGLIKGSA